MARPAGTAVHRESRSPKPCLCSVPWSRRNRPVAPRTVDPERRHPHEANPRVDPAHLFPTEVEVFVEDPRGVVLENEITPSDDRPKDIKPLRAPQIYRQAALVRIRVRLRSSVFPPVTVVGGRICAATV